LIQLRKQTNIENMDSRIDTITTKKHRGRTRIRNIVKKVLQRLDN